MQVTFSNKPLNINIRNLMILTIFIYLKLTIAIEVLSNECRLIFVIKHITHSVMANSLASAADIATMALGFTVKSCLFVLT